MAEESHQDNKADCTDVQPVPWNQTDLIIYKISTFLGPTDLSSFRLVCQNWNKESSSIWEYHRMRHTLRRYSKLGSKSLKALDNPKPLTVFKEYLPPKECDFDCVGAEKLRDFFSHAKKDDAKLMETSFRVVKLKQWNCFGVFPSGQQEGAKWFLNKVADKVVHLTLDRCNLSISRGEFFPKLCQMNQLQKLTFQGTCFQLRPSHPVEPTLDEISWITKLRALEINFEKFTKKRMKNYNFPWNLFLEATPNLIAVVFSYYNWNNLAFANQQFSKLVGILKEKQAMMPSDSMDLIIFKKLSGPNEDPVIMKTDVIKMVQGSLKNLGIGSSLKSQSFLPPYISAHLYDLPIVIKFQGHQDNIVKEKDFAVLEVFSRGTIGMID